ncbi:hypothetical protein [Variovorax ginsengisoli]|uniref:Uncharacterized protein n=1 Tax=Variovorax ginsengisoli TaxID=363844 RepID=A0ABT8S9N3_9BURK|nr:hypothetical protein [Variovorax ginsengisoli]MDN8616460.1 hypothetical protein [Variovorax ginsengisoli]MDO1535630.1 hypothetical protein [Variovorax ginsengisoli]
MSSAPDPNVEVMLDVFSGRPNPLWALSEPQIQELRALLAASLHARVDVAAEPPYLGYRGFVIFNRRKVEEIPRKVEVFGGMLLVDDEPSGKRSVYTDPFGLEAWLLEQARERGHAETIAQMGGPCVHRGPRKPC